MDKLEKNGQATAKKSRAKKTTKALPQKLKLLFTIVNRSKAEFYTDLLQEYDVNMQLSMFGNGTASTEILQYLGLADSEKAVIISVIREEKVSSALALLDEKFKTVKNGKGIAYTVPLTSIIGVAIYQFLSNNRMSVKDEKQADGRLAEREA